MKRRTFIAALTLAPAASSVPALAQSAGRLDAGLSPDDGADQSSALQSAMGRAAQAGVELFLPAGRYRVAGLSLPSGLSMVGIAGESMLESATGGPVFRGSDVSNISLDGIGLDGASGGSSDMALLVVENCTNLRVENCGFTSARGNGATLYKTSGRFEGCTFSSFGETALHLQDSTGMIVTGNRIADCGNGGVRVWRYENGFDGTIVSGNQISGIGSTSGNGQNGNGINVFQADGVVCSGNVIWDCDFSALRANTTNDTIFEGNQCRECREVAIFSEFGFSGSIVSNNLIDNAATGISITNLDSEGYLAVCSGNIVRNITRNSPTNPDTVPVGIFAEAEVAVTGNVVENVPGAGILAGWGPYLRNVLVSDNVVRDCLIGIAVSVADGAGAAKVSNNLVAGSTAASIAGMRWRDIASADLARDADLYPQLSISGNLVS